MTPAHEGRLSGQGERQHEHPVDCRTGWDVTAVEVSSVALARLADATGTDEVAVPTVVADMEAFLRSGKRFDPVVVSFMDPAPAQRAGFLVDVVSAVAPEGHFFFIGHHLASLRHTGPPEPDAALLTFGAATAVAVGAVGAIGLGHRHPTPAGAP